MKWSKYFCRESLAFRRFLREEKKLKTGDNEYISLTNSFYSYQNMENSAKGIEASDIDKIKNGKDIAKIAKKIQSQPIPNIHYDKIKTIVVLGHGIEADKQFLKNIVEKCINLKDCVIFRYAGEGCDSFKNKKDFFIEYGNIVPECY